MVPVPEELTGQNEAQLDRALTRKGIEFILADPERYLWLTLDKTLEYFKFWPSSDSQSNQQSEPGTLFWFIPAIYAFGAVLILFALAQLCALVFIHCHSYRYSSALLACTSLSITRGCRVQWSLPGWPYSNWPGS